MTERETDGPPSARKPALRPQPKFRPGAGTASQRRARPRQRGEVVSVLARRILSGAVPPGGLLPREGDLCAEFGVSRTVVREATKMLQAKGLILSRPRVGTEVCQPESWNLLDPELLAWAGEDFHDPRLVRSLMEARRIVEPAAAAMAAERATEADLAALQTALERMTSLLPHDIEAGAEADVAFHTALLHASHNHVLICLAGVIRAAMRALLEATNRVSTSHAGAMDLHAGVLAAVRARDPLRARQAIEAILDGSERDIALLERSG